MQQELSGDCISTMVEDPVIKAIRDRINVINQRDDPTDKDNAFYIVDLGEVYRLHQKWSRNLSQVSPFYGRREQKDHTLRGKQLTRMIDNSGQVQSRS